MPFINFICIMTNLINRIFSLSIICLTILACSAGLLTAQTLTYDTPGNFIYMIPSTGNLNVDMKGGDGA